MSEPALTLIYASSDQDARAAFRTAVEGVCKVHYAATGFDAQRFTTDANVIGMVADASLSDILGTVLLANLAVPRPGFLKILATTAEESHHLVQAINDSRVHGVLMKPFKAEELGRILRPLIKAHQSGEGAQEDSMKMRIELAATQQELRDTQNQLIVSEKMAALGQLVANVGHELNTPISAIKSQSQSTDKLLRPFVQDLPRLFLLLDKPDLALFQELMVLAATNEKDLTTREERQYRREFEEKFVALGAEDPAEMAKQLVEMQLVEDMDRFLKLFVLPVGEEVMKVIRHLGQLRGALNNINIAAEKVTKIILALKSYSRISREEKFEPVSLDQSIQGILTIYHNLLKHGVQVIKHYEEIPPIPGIPDQLGQVWANIIQNAIQAMGGKGTLSIDVKVTDPYVVVSIGDSGPGIPAEIVNRIFEPFFTTRATGEGTGLGLDITRRIVERHMGKITVESVPGNTVFYVHLQLEQTQLRPEPLAASAV